ncbi:MAG: DEAD/DEAH box helicase family protein [Caulobacteraceae bacterium]|nr:DEAD/DEAH box helicase family protein [Caulobacteraceae bacterium]
MNEAETRAELVDPALAAAGWGVVAESRVRREVITPGRILGAGRRGEPTTADYVLTYRNHKLAVIEAKARGKGVTEGLGQAKAYAGKLQARFAFSTNGAGLYQIDMATGAEGPVDRYPTPQELWAMTFAEANAWRDRFAAVPLEDKGGTQPPYYFQVVAIDKALEAIAAGRRRILLTLATGTGKTLIAFQIAWKLFYARWNLGGEPTRRPRVLFLADRNILADQAYNAFSAFPEDALVRIAPDQIRKKGRVPKNGAVFFTIFQTFTSGRDDAFGRPEGYFGDYPADFFDFIIVDECHRGGAQDESTWRGILEYFAPAVQLGLTATPRRKDNVDTYRYFGEPVFIYSLKQGIEDGFLTPFKVRQIATTLDDYVWTPDDQIIDGVVEEGRLYGEGDFNRVIEIDERERYRVKTFIEMIDQREKTLVFCRSQDHAAAARDYINQIKTSSDPDYCVRVTANDGAFGDQHLRTFQDNEKTIPTILTTSQKLSTGVDARNVRNIVLLRPVNSLIEFKQIIGRGTRLFDGKDYFTIYDFVKAYAHFSDPEWDGEPLDPAPSTPTGPRGPGAPAEPPDGADGDTERPTRLKIRLADGKERAIRHISATTFWGPDGRPMSAAQFVEALYGQLPQLFRDEEELRSIWGRPDARRALLAALAERGFGGEQLAEMSKLIDAEKSDVFDVLAYIAFTKPPITRADRVETRAPDILSRYDPKLQAFIGFVLGQYVSQGVEELDDGKLARLLELKYQTLHDAMAELGDAPVIREAFVGFQAHLFSAGAAG